MALKDRDKLEAIRDGICEWVAYHPVSTCDAIDAGASKAVNMWLEKYSDRIIEAIATRVASDPSSLLASVEIAAPLPVPDDGVRCDHDDVNAVTPAEVRESAYRRGVDHGLEMATILLENGGDLAKLKDLHEVIDDWRHRRKEFLSLDLAEVRRPPWPKSKWDR